MAKRARHPMPPEVRPALEEAGLPEARAARPPYQRNDTLGWIARARREETRERRLRQMLEELEVGDVYMKGEYRPRGG